MAISTVFRVSLPPVVMDDGDVFIYDDIRGKWLGSHRIPVIAGRKGRAKNAYLRLIDGQASNLTGYRMPRTATIVALTAQTRDNETWILRVRKNGDPTDIASLAITNAAGGHDTAVDIDVEEGDRIQLFAETTSFFGIKDPFAWIEIAWRNENL